MSDKPTIADIAMLVARLVHQLRKRDPNNQVAEKAMNYLRRKDLAGSVLREIEQNMDVCNRCDGDGKAHGSDRPFEWSGPDTYPGPCPVCKGSGKAVPENQ